MIVRLPLTEQAKNNFLAGIANDLRNELVRAAPFKTGTLANSLSIVKQADGSYAISAVHYSLYVEFGTAHHVINAKNGKALHWRDGGSSRFAVRVVHPGTRPNPFIRRTLKNELPRIIARNVKLHLVTVA